MLLLSWLSANHKQAKCLVLYEEYGLRCDAMHLFADLLKAPSDSSNYDRALEILQASICPSGAKFEMAKKALGLKDLLIKVSSIWNPYR